MFAVDLAKAELAMKNIKLEPKLSERTCEKCGAPMAEKFNKRGKFLGCSRYPECKNTMPMEGPRAKSESIPTDKVCEKCGAQGESSSDVETVQQLHHEISIG